MHLDIPALRGRKTSSCPGPRTPMEAAEFSPELCFASVLHSRRWNFVLTKFRYSPDTARSIGMITHLAADAAEYKLNTLGDCTTQR